MDLPYYEKKKFPQSVEEGRNFPLGLTRQPDDGFELLSSLTGVSSQVDNRITATANSRSRVTDATSRKETSRAVDKGVGGGLSGDSDSPIQHNNVERSLTKVLPCLEKGLDTCDLGFWTCMVLPDRKSDQEDGSISDADSEEQEQPAEKTALQEKTCTEDCTDEDEHSKQREYWARIKETLGFVQMRMQMLQELSLGSGAKGENPLTVGANKDSQGANASGVNGASMNIKQARKLAGLVHMEEQALHLQDLHQWLHNVGKGLEEDAMNALPKSPLQNKLEFMKRLNIAKELQETTPSHGSFELLQQVEHNLRDRLANLYQVKNFILSIQSSDKLGPEAIYAKEGALERLQKIESAYEMLGSTIIDSLKQVEKMEEEFHMLQSELKAKGCPLLTVRHIKKIKKMHKKGTKKLTHSENDGGSEASSVASSARVASAKSEKESSTKIDEGGDINGNADAKDISNDSKTDGKDINSRTKNGKMDMENVSSDETVMVKSDKTSKNGRKKEKKKSHAQKAKERDNKTNIFREGKSYENPAPHAATSLSSHQVVDGTVQPVSPSTVTEVPHLPIIAAEDMNANGIALSENRETLLNNSGRNGHLPMRKSTFSAEKRNTSQETSFSIKDRDNVKPRDSEAFQNAAKSKRQFRRSCFEGYTEEAVQTDDVAIISLEDGCDDAFSSRYDQMDIKDVVENMKKLQKQLQFWRAKNWAEKHTGRNGKPLQAPVYSSVSQFTKMHTSPDMGLVLYYNPQTGLRTIKSVSDLDSNTQQAIFSLTSETRHNGNNT